MNAKFMVQWLPRGKKYPRGLIAEGPMQSFDAAMNFGAAVMRKARSVVILRDSGEGINAGKFFLDYILK